MKTSKKLVAIFMAIAMLFAFVCPTLADDAPAARVSGTNDNSGKITISNAIEGQTYTVYQLLVLESYNTDTNSFSYKAAADWSDFINGSSVKGVYLNVDTNGYVTWVEGADAADFAKLAQSYAKDNSIDNQGSTTATTTTVEFENLNLGYYLVDTTLGTLCSLDTTNPEVSIQEKNAVPTVEKKVEEDSNSEYGATNDADIGQTVNFKSTITAQAGAENYVFHDKMSSGLTYTGVTKITLNDVDVDSKYYTVKTTDLADDCTFEVTFTQTFCDTLKADDKIVIYYTAKVNENAVIGLPGNPNQSQLSYGDSTNTKITPVTPESTTTTYTWDLDVLKYANGNETNVLKDAQFVLLNNSDPKKVAVIENKKFTKWVDIPEAVGGTITWPENTVLTTDASGKIEIDGLDADTYYLREIKAPVGYNKLPNDVTAIVKGAEEDSESDNKLKYETVIVKVNNQSGTELPSTGGIGTTIFYIVGSIMCVGAAVLLVTRRRMNMKG